MLEVTSQAESELRVHISSQCILETSYARSSMIIGLIVLAASFSMIRSRPQVIAMLLEGLNKVITALA